MGDGKVAAHDAVLLAIGLPKAQNSGGMQ